MYLGIEIGGTKLQFGVGEGDGSEFVAFERRNVDIKAGAEGIREQIRSVGRQLISAHPIQRVAYGFGGPILGELGIVQTSHQVSGWDSFPLVEWTQSELGVPTLLGNDCDVAALAEASFGAGRQSKSLFYVTVGTGIGGGLVLNRRIHGRDRPAAAEIGHLRPGLECITSGMTVESRSAGPGIALATQAHVRELLRHGAPSSEIRDLLDRCGEYLDALSTKEIGEAAVAGNRLAKEQYVAATRVLGWAIAQVVTLIAPEIVVVGGGVSLVGEEVFFQPLRNAVQQFVFPPLSKTVNVVPAALGESVVVHGALAFAKHGDAG